MAHRISHQNGRDEIAYSGETPWHGLGVTVAGLQTAAEMLRHAGLLWTVSTVALYRERGRAGEAAPLAEHHDIITGWRGIVRDDVNALLGVASERYTPVQNTQAGEIMDALITEGGAHVEVCGALDAGERCWMLAHIPADFEVVAGDVVRPYMLLAWGHDGKHGVAGKLTPIRVVCNNTLTAAGFGAHVRWSAVADFYIRHSGKVQVRIEEAQRALGVIRKQTDDTRTAYQALARPIEGQQAPLYFAAVFPLPEVGPGESTASEEYRAKLERWEAHQARLLEHYQSGVGVDIPGVRGTAWAAYNAVTEWADHDYPRLKSGEVSAHRQQSVLFGSMADVKRRALTAALDLVGASTAAV